MPRNVPVEARLKRVNIFLSTQELDALADYSIRCGLGRGEIMRRVLDEFLQGEGYVLDRGSQVMRVVPQLAHKDQ